MTAIHTTGKSIYEMITSSAMNGTHQSKDGPFVIIDHTPFGIEPAMDKVRFLNTGTELWFHRNSTATGRIKDPTIRDKYGIGYMGVGPNGATIIDANCKHRKSPAYVTWRAMIWRCYANGNQCYKGVTVHPRWHNFQNFCEDIKHLEGYQMWADYQAGIRPHGIIELDKDLKAIPGQPKQYGPETCCFLTKVNNLKVRWNRPLHPAGVERIEEADHHPA